MSEKMFTIGKIINTHGLKGEVKVLRISDFDERFEAGKPLFIVMENKQPIQVEIATHRVHKGFDLIFFKGYETIDDVEHLRDSYLKITEEQLTDLDENEYYYHEIINCDVFLTTGEHIGVVKEILSPGANDVWVVKPEKGKDVLIPYIDDVVKEINIDAKEIIIEPIEGLLD